MEKLLDTALGLIRDAKIDLWIVDSIGALVPKGDILESDGKERSLEKNNMLNLQKKLGEFYRKANIYIAPTDTYKGCAVLMVGQVYTVPDAHVPLEAVRGGNSVKHWAHLRLLFRRGPKSDWPEPVEIVGHDGQKRKVYPGWSGRIKVDKTRINGNEGREILLPFIHGKGFDSIGSTINSAFGLGLITRTGAYYNNQYLPDGKVMGREAVLKFFSENQEAYDKLYSEVANIALQDLESKDEQDE